MVHNFRNIFFYYQQSLPVLRGLLWFCVTHIKAVLRQICRIMPSSPWGIGNSEATTPLSLVVNKRSLMITHIGQNLLLQRRTKISSPFKTVPVSVDFLYCLGLKKKKKRGRCLKRSIVSQVWRHTYVIGCRGPVQEMAEQLLCDS